MSGRHVPCTVQTEIFALCGRQGGLHESCDVSMKSMLRETMPFPCSSSGSSGGSGGGSSGGGSSRSISSVVVQ